jgi:hypothetical protein
MNSLEKRIMARVPEQIKLKHQKVVQTPFGKMENHSYTPEQTNMEKILVAYMAQNGFGTKAECIDLIKKHGFQKTVDACAFAEKAVPTLSKGGE